MKGANTKDAPSPYSLSHVSLGWFFFNEEEKAHWGGEGILYKPFTGSRARYSSTEEPLAARSDVASGNWEREQCQACKMLPLGATAQSHLERSADSCGKRPF